MADEQTAKTDLPRAGRPHMPGYGVPAAGEGSGLLPWSWAVEHLTVAHNYWLSTTRPDGRPHVMPVWGLWLEGAFYFSTSAGSRKAKNLALNPYCVVCPENAEEAIVLEGVAGAMVDAARDPALHQQLCALSQAKYDFDMSGHRDPFYAVRPRVAFAFNEKDDFAGSATRWTFPDK